MDSLVIQIQLTTDQSGCKSRSDLTRALTLVTFLSVFYVQGLPEQGLSSTVTANKKCFMPPKNLCP